jgi:hypothetical protein
VYRGHGWSRNTLSGVHQATAGVVETGIRFRAHLGARTSDLSSTQNFSGSLSDTLGVKHARDYDAGSLDSSQAPSAFEAAPNAELEIKGEKRDRKSMVV